MARIDWRNMALRILSVVLALLLWIFATNERNPVQDQILSVSLSKRGLPGGMVVANDIPPAVSIRVQGNRGQVVALTSTDFEAVLDLSKVGEGEQHIPVRVTPPQGIQVSKVTPEKIYVVAESIVEQQVGVKASLKGTPAKGYAAMEPVIQPALVTVKGPRSKVSTVSQVSVTVDVESVVSQVEKMLPVNSGENGVTVFPQTVKVTVPVTLLPSKSVPVRARASGTPAKDYEIDGFVIKPAEVQVVAPASELAGINWVETEKVDVKGADRDITVKAGLSLPPGAVEAKPSTVDVTVKLKKTGTTAPPADPARPPG
ncbi:MAG: YbbR-like domain-containing protein [Bacillota bacterium]